MGAAMFDLAFMLCHFMLKALHLPQRARGLAASALRTGRPGARRSAPLPEGRADGPGADLARRRGRRTAPHRGAHRRRGAPPAARPVGRTASDDQRGDGQRQPVRRDPGRPAHPGPSAAHGHLRRPRPADRHPVRHQADGPGRISRLPAPPHGPGRPRPRPCSPTTPSPGCTASPPAFPALSTTPPPPPDRTSSTMLAPGKQSPSSPGTDRSPAASGMTRAEALRWWRVATRPAPVRRARAAGSRPAGPDHRQSAGQDRRAATRNPSTRSPASSPATTAAETDHHTQAPHQRQALPEHAHQTMPNHVQTTWPLTAP